MTHQEAATKLNFHPNWKILALNYIRMIRSSIRDFGTNGMRAEAPMLLKRQQQDLANRRAKINAMVRG
jgi:hypothetical protein